MTVDTMRRVLECCHKGWGQSIIGGKILIDPLITHTLPLEGIHEASDMMHRGESIRSGVRDS